MAWINSRVSEEADDGRYGSFGSSHVGSGPLARSAYHAEQQVSRRKASQLNS